MQITAQMVKELRERTGAGMMDCKNALTETGGNFEQAVDLLRKKGLAAAAKRSGRVAAEGLVSGSTSPAPATSPSPVPARRVASGWRHTSTGGWPTCGMRPSAHPTDPGSRWPPWAASRGATAAH